MFPPKNRIPTILASSLRAKTEPSLVTSEPRRLHSTSSRLSSTESFPKNAPSLSLLTSKKSYLQTPLDQPEYVRIKLSNTPQDFIDEYKIMDYVRLNGWIYFEIRNGVYGLSQLGALTNGLLEHRLK